MAREHRLFALLYDRIMAPLERQGLGELRSRLLAPLTGHVLEVGAGTGANLAHYRDAALLTLLEPDAAMARRLTRRLAAAHPPPAAEVRVATLEEARLPDASVDAAVSTMVLCSVPDPAHTLGELRRVLRPGGRLVLIEHVRHPARAAGLLQDALTPLQRTVAGGCRLNRRTMTLLGEAGFDTTGVEPVGIFSRIPPLAAGIAGVALAPAGV